MTSYVAMKMVEMPLVLGAHLTFSSGSDSCSDQRVLLAFRTGLCICVLPVKARGGLVWGLSAAVLTSSHLQGIGPL